MSFFKKPFVFAVVFSLVLSAFTAFALLDTFVIPHVIAADPAVSESDSGTSSGAGAGLSVLDAASVQSYNESEHTVTLDDGITVSIPEGATFDAADNTVTFENGETALINENGELITVSKADTASVSSKISVVSAAEGSAASSQQSSESHTASRQPSSPVITDTSYKDDNISITITSSRQYDSNYYLADIRLSSSEYLKTALAQDTFGTNINEKPSAAASRLNALLAVNGDFYGANNEGYVIKNGRLYRSSVRSETKYDDLVIYADGSMGTINETEVSAAELIRLKVLQLFAFGPTLVNDYDVVVGQNVEVGIALPHNPRTAIGIIGKLHYCILVSDGRTAESAGMTLYELAQVMKQAGCVTAYNLDGGGSSVMWFNGRIVNKPTTYGKTIEERAVSDIVYIGY